MCVSNEPGFLYVVATPIGNLEDFSIRARRILAEVDLIAAEDTRHSARLLSHYGILTPVTAFHEHNEHEKAQDLVNQLSHGKQLALISDAGTPLVSDPGYRLVRAAHIAGIRVIPVPGPCAAVAALSVSGLPSDRFAFEGFPPAKSTARRTWLEAMVNEPRTLIFYESPHRIVESLADMVSVFGETRDAVYARELTKQFETVRPAPLGELARWVSQDSHQQLGEIVILVHGARADEEAARADAERIVRILLKSLPVSQAAAVAAELSGRKKNELYELALSLKKSPE
ncbi:MAG TPA: 16S rRNA (cytidine(1402)-2'-O)-methyltransferase [Gammaproteobacteria bacterium]|nr:16S rRNA (cytidine(1402)-2'-O)-methyltransferase [Gammaproteobacteria bacterium]